MHFRTVLLVAALLVCSVMGETISKVSYTSTDCSGTGTKATVGVIGECFDTAPTWSTYTYTDSDGTITEIFFTDAKCTTPSTTDKAVTLGVLNKCTIDGSASFEYTSDAVPTDAPTDAPTLTSSTGFSSSNSTSHATLLAAGGISLLAAIVSLF